MNMLMPSDRLCVTVLLKRMKSFNQLSHRNWFRQVAGITSRAARGLVAAYRDP